MKMIVVSIPLIIAVIVAVVLFTNVDEKISEAVEIDTSTLNLVTNTWPIDSICDVYLAKYVEMNKPDPSQWYLENFAEERKILFGDSVESNAEFQSIINQYNESLNKKTTPDLRDRVLATGGFPKEKAQEDPQCYEILLEKYPNMMK